MHKVGLHVAHGGASGLKESPCLAEVTFAPGYSNTVYRVRRMPRQANALLR